MVETLIPLMYDVDTIMLINAYCITGITEMMAKITSTHCN